MRYRTLHTRFSVKDIRWWFDTRLDAASVRFRRIECRYFHSHVFFSLHTIKFNQNAQTEVKRLSMQTRFNIDSSSRLSFIFISVCLTSLLDGRSVIPSCFSFNHINNNILYSSILTLNLDPHATCQDHLNTSLLPPYHPILSSLLI